MWDQEYECVGKDPKGQWTTGVRVCDPASLAYEETCHVAEGVCPLGLARGEDGSCRCFAHMPCGDSDDVTGSGVLGAHSYSDTHHFALCHPSTGELSPCMAIGSVFAPIVRVRSNTPQPGGGPQMSSTWTYSTGAWVAFSAFALVFAIFLYVMFWQWGRDDAYVFTHDAVSRMMRKKKKKEEKIEKRKNGWQSRKSGLEC